MLGPRGRSSRAVVIFLKRCERQWSTFRMEWCISWHFLSNIYCKIFYLFAPQVKLPITPKQIQRSWLPTINLLSNIATNVKIPQIQVQQQNRNKIVQSDINGPRYLKLLVFFLSNLVHEHFCILWIRLQPTTRHIQGYSLNQLAKSFWGLKLYRWYEFNVLYSFESLTGRDIIFENSNGTRR